MGICVGICGLGSLKIHMDSPNNQRCTSAACVYAFICPFYIIYFYIVLNFFSSSFVSQRHTLSFVMNLNFSFIQKLYNTNNQIKIPHIQKKKKKKNPPNKKKKKKKKKK